MSQIWSSLTKDLNDNTTIDEEIDAKIDAHNADVDAHLGDDESLQSHRASAIIDHVAKSVVNDKMADRARAYIAIVDTTSESDFDTIAGAVEYALENGGGNILITPGTHDIGTVIDVDRGVNLIGIDVDTCIVRGNGNLGEYFKFAEVDTGIAGVQYFKNLTFESTNTPIFRNAASSVGYENKLIVEDCYFKGSGEYFNCDIKNAEFVRCTIELKTTAAFKYTGFWAIKNSKITAKNTSGGALLCEESTAYVSDPYMEIINCNIDRTSTGDVDVLNAGDVAFTRINDNEIRNLKATTITTELWQVRGNIITFTASGYLQLDSTQATVYANVFSGGTGNRLRFGAASTRNNIFGNIVRTAITNSGTANLLTANITS